MRGVIEIFKKSTFGQLSIAMLLICIVSGIFLVVPYNVDKPLLSISNILVLNPAASLIRNLHFWSAQFFLIFSLIHIWEHFRKKQKIRLKWGVWLRLTIGIMIIFMVMITGFILKGDADSQQAWRILNSLLTGVPFVGDLLARSFLGREDSLQVVYIHHVATFTVVILVITFEHSRKIWPKVTETVISIVIAAFFSVLFTAPLHDGLNPVVKGPWYFVGFQEILHWLTHPDLSLIIILIFLLLIFIIPFSKEKISTISKRTLLFFTVFYLIVTLSGMFFRGEHWKWIWPWQDGYSYEVMSVFKTPAVNLANEFTDEQLEAGAIIDGKTESCVVCHENVMGFTDSHNPDAIGCASCHGGNIYASRKEAAHRGMILIPGNFDNVERSCGTANCHPDIVERRNSSLMANLSGMISVDRFVFNEQDNPDILTDIHHLGDSPADEHLRNLCVRCHIGNPKTEPEPVTEKSRGGGCLACHINYSDSAEIALNNYLAIKSDTAFLHHHPEISLNVTDMHCFGCHSRSGRISTSYQGWHETTLAVEDMPDDKKYKVFEETRVFTKMPADVHYNLGLECVDCHNSYEVMGDGNYYAHQDEQVSISCEDCHFDGEPLVVASGDMDRESALIATLRFGNIQQREFIKTKKRDIPIINTFVRNDTSFFITKNTKQQFVLSSPAEICTKGQAHSTVSCAACHSSWAPSCIGCHNEYDPEEPGYNMIANKEKKGSWVEYIGEYNAGLPALGIRTTDKGENVVPVVPGMVLSIDVSGFSREQHDSLIFHRLFAPTSPHTTSKEGRSCESCHNDPVALGYGRGKLEYVVDNGKGYWLFNSYYRNNPNDGIPEDAWVSFLSDRKGETLATRSNVLPFSIDKQKRILTVGACLTCHNENSVVMQQSLASFDSILMHVSDKCVLPVWGE